MVIADDDAFARIFAAHNVTGDGLRHNARVRERKIFRDDAAPAIGSNRIEVIAGEYTRCDMPAKQPDWPVVEAGRLRRRPLQELS